MEIDLGRYRQAFVVAIYCITYGIAYSSIALHIQSPHQCTSQTVCCIHCSPLLSPSPFPGSFSPAPRSRTSVRNPMYDRIDAVMRRDRLARSCR